ncbi:MAG TPA: DNA-processing protein DprA [Candidatus Dormibacteraeota bacterium]|nr:DNA-processing protein DprA [Candidatus Dormibacteraeota bacterium]
MRAEPAEPSGWRVLLPADPGYPVLLRRTAEAPPLMLRGTLPAGAWMVAVVGSRRSTPYGEELAFALGAELAAAGLVVVSGLARGIDAAAHRGALSAGGRTVAVMGTGPDTIYPAAHRALAERIAGGGALVTQFPPGTPPLPANFPIRNAVISGLSLGVVVVEARRRSGAMITAGAAAEQGRTVMAVPGSVHSPNSAGCHALIRDQAVLVAGPRDVLEVVAGEPLRHLLAPGPALAAGPPGEPAIAAGASAPSCRDTPPPDPVLQLLEGRPATLEEVRRALGVTPREAAARVTRLRAEGLVGLSGGLYVALHPRPSAPFGAVPAGAG